MAWSSDLEHFYGTPALLSMAEVGLHAKKTGLDCHGADMWSRYFLIRSPSSMMCIASAYAHENLEPRQEAWQMQFTLPYLHLTTVCSSQNPRQAEIQWTKCPNVKQGARSASTGKMSSVCRAIKQQCNKSGNEIVLFKSLSQPPVKSNVFQWFVQMYE